jgi:hypothetical protein
MAFTKPKTARRTKAPASPAQQFQRKCVILLGQLEGLPYWNKSILKEIRRHWGYQAGEQLEADIKQLEITVRSYAHHLRTELQNIKGILHDKAQGVSIQRRNVHPDRPWQETVFLNTDP